MTNKENNKVVTIQKENRITIKTFEHYFMFGIIVLFIGFVIGTTTSAVTLYNAKDDTTPEIDTTVKMIKIDDKEEDNTINTEDIDLEYFNENKGE